MRRFFLVLVATFSFACGMSGPRPLTAPVPEGKALEYLRTTLIPYPTPDSHGRLALTDPIRKRLATYDSALLILVLMRYGFREEAGRVIEGLRAVQRADGSVPFSFTLPRPEDGIPYVRAGAVAWVGYAAAEYLDADRAGPVRAEAIALARGAATYVMERQVAKPDDPRDGLVLGGAGGFRYEVDEKGRLRERLELEDIEWASVEHNIDAFFFLRALARVTGEAPYRDAAARIAKAVARTWNGSAGQLARGVTTAGPDDVFTLDCAAWGSVLLGGVGERQRAETSASVADASFDARDERTSARGHRAQLTGAVLESVLLQRELGAKLAANDWSNLKAIWPEGSAGVALAAWRAGRTSRAGSILAALEPLRAPNGSLPTSTLDVPYLFDTRPSIAGTAWVELVRFELGREPGHPTFWVP